MRWVITLSATKDDVERLLAASIEGLSPHPSEAGEVLLELQDAFGDESTGESRRTVKDDIDLRVRHINGFGKLRCGRVRGRRGQGRPLLRLVRRRDAAAVRRNRLRT